MPQIFKNNIFLSVAISLLLFSFGLYYSHQYVNELYKIKNSDLVAIGPTVLSKAPIFQHNKSKRNKPNFTLFSNQYSNNFKSGLAGFGCTNLYKIQGDLWAGDTVYMRVLEKDYQQINYANSIQIFSLVKGDTEYLDLDCYNNCNKIICKQNFLISFALIPLILIIGLRNRTIKIFGYELEAFGQIILFGIITALLIYLKTIE